MFIVEYNKLGGKNYYTIYAKLKYFERIINYQDTEYYNNCSYLLFLSSLKMY
jgi:hypothetical protein